MVWDKLKEGIEPMRRLIGAIFGICAAMLILAVLWFLTHPASPIYSEWTLIGTALVVVGAAGGVIGWIVTK